MKTLSLAALLALPALPAAAHMDTAELAKFYQDNPDIAKKQESFKKRLKEMQKNGDKDLPPPSEPVQSSDLPPDSDPRADLLSKVPVAKESYMADLIAEYEEEKGQLVEENIRSAAEALATPETQPLYREYLRQVYQRKAGGGDRGYHTNWIISRLEQPNGWKGSFPSLKIGPLPPGVAGLWSGGNITLISQDIVVLSHEWYHHTDNANGMDGNSHRNEGPEPWEILAYAEMGKEL